MFGSLTSMLNKLKTTKIAQNISDNYHKITQRPSKKMAPTEIAPNLFHIPYPTLDDCNSLKQHIGDSDFEVWNISEYPYDKQLEARILQSREQGQLRHLCFEYYSNLPLYELITALNSIHAFLALSPSNRVYLHCQDNKMRSAVFLACFLYKFKVGGIQDLSEAILLVNGRLSVGVEAGSAGEGSSQKYNSLHIFFKNFVNFLNNPAVINTNQLQLLKIIVNQPPSLLLSKEMVVEGGRAQLKVGVEIRCRQQVVMKGVYQSSVFTGDSLCLELGKKAVVVSDDFLVMLKYVYRGKIYNMMRMQLNTNFIYDCFNRTHIQYVDLSGFCLLTPATFTDFIFHTHPQLSNLAKLTHSPAPKHPLGLPEHPLGLAEDPLGLGENQLNLGKQPRQQAQEKQEEVEQASKLGMENFSVQELEEEREEVDESDINRKIQEVIKSIGKKESQKQEQAGEDDFDDYLSKLQSQL